MVVAVVGKVVARSFVADSGLAMFQVFAIQYAVQYSTTCPADTTFLVVSLLVVLLGMVGGGRGWRARCIRAQKEGRHAKQRSESIT